MKMTSSHESLKVFSCCEVLTTVFTRKTEITSSHEYLYAFSYCEVLWLYFSTYWKDSGYGFQLVENIQAMVFNLLKKFWLCFSTCWKIYGYAFQPVEKNLAMLFNFWKVIFYEFQVSEKFSSMVFRAWKVQKSLTVSLITVIIYKAGLFHLRSVKTMWWWLETEWDMFPNITRYRHSSR